MKIIWSSRYDCNIEFINIQHKKLISIFNNLEDIFEDNILNKSQFTNLFNELEEYANYHFKTEENIMQIYSTKDILIKHSKEHIQFVEFFKIIKGNGFTKKEIEIILLFLEIWINKHILIIDKNTFVNMNF